MKGAATAVRMTNRYFKLKKCDVTNEKHINTSCIIIMINNTYRLHKNQHFFY